MIFIILLLTFIFSAICATLVIPYIVKKTEDPKFLDKPNYRKIHTTPISRFGGLAFLPIVFIFVNIFVFLIIPTVVEWKEDTTYGFTPLWRLLIVMVSSATMYITGVIDDLYGIGYKIKFVMQIVAASIIGFGILLPITGFSYHIFVVIFFVIYVINAINMIDGLDGLASGIGIITLVVILFAEFSLNNLLGATIAASLLGVLCVFFYFNVFSWKNKIFMGDTGSMTLGTIIAFLVLSVAIFESKIRITGIYYYTPIVLAPLLIPMLDLMRVAICRVFKRKNPCMPDKTHIHHRLLEYGLTCQQTLRYILYATAMLTIGVWGLVTICYVIE